MWGGAGRTGSMGGHDADFIPSDTNGKGGKGGSGAVIIEYII